MTVKLRETKHYLLPSYIW